METGTERPVQRIKPRESGWRTSDGITHHIDTRRYNAYHSHMRGATCGIDLRQARRVRFDAVDCITCIVRVARRPRLPPRPTPSATTPSWWTKDGDRHVRSTNDPWRAVCSASLRTASASGSPPSCVVCGATPGAITRTRSRRTPDGVRHVIHLDDPEPARRAPCGVDLIEAQVVRKAPNCVGCRAAEAEARRIQEGRNRGRLPRTQRR